MRERKKKLKTNMSFLVDITQIVACGGEGRVAVLLSL